MTRLHEQYTIVRDSPLVVIGVLDDDLSELGIDATFGIGVADGIRLTISRDAEIADRLRCPDGGPLTIWVRLTAAHLPEREVDDGGIELMTAVEPRPTIGLVCTRDWIDDLARNPAEAHASLVARLMEGVMELWELPSESVETFLRAWNLTPPIGLLRPYSASLLPRHLGKDNLVPRTFATRGRAHRRLRIATFSLPLERYEGREAVKLCKDELLPAMQAVPGTGRSTMRSKPASASAAPDAEPQTMMRPGRLPCGLIIAAHEPSPTSATCRSNTLILLPGR